MATPGKKIVTIRESGAVVDEVRRLAERDAESQSTVIRRLIRRGLEAERAAVSGAVTRGAALVETR